MLLKSETANRYILLLWGILLFLIFCFPRILSSIKVLLLVLILVLHYFLNGEKIYIEKYLLLFLILQITYTLLKISVGIMYGNAKQAMLNSIRVEIIYAILFVILFSGLIRRKGFVKSSLTWLANANIYIGLFNIFIVLASYTGFNASLILKLDATAGVGIHTGYSHVVSTNLSMSIITFPLSLFSSNCEIDCQKKKQLIGALLCGLAMILSGRRILWLCLGITVVFYTFSISKDPLKLLKRVTTALFVAILIVILAQVSGMFDFESVADRFISAFGKGENAETERTVQIGYLLEGFANKPILGNGAGAIIDGYARSETTPWSFEMTYHALLFQTGFVGTMLYFLSISFLLLGIMQIRHEARRFYMGCFVSLFLAVIANATNPYYGSSFDFEIFLFLPTVLAMGYHKMEKRII